MKHDSTDDLDPVLDSLETEDRMQWFRQLPDAVSAFLDFLGTVLLSTIWYFVRTWSVSRPLGPLARGLPAVLAAISILLLAVLVRERGSGENAIARYRQSIAAAVQRGDLQSASLWMEKIAQQSASSPVYEFRLGILAADQGDLLKARGIMQRLAPRERAGYPDAHYWLAQDLIRQNRSLTPEMAQIVEHHLNQAMRSEQVRDKVEVILGHLYLTQRDWDRATEHLQKAARQMPELYVTLSRLHRSLGDPKRAQDAALRGAAHFRSLALSEPEHWKHRLQWALCELLVDDYSAAIQILEPLLNEPDVDRSIRETLAVAYQGKFNQTLAEDPPNVGRQLELLNQTLLLDPTNSGALAILADMTTVEPETRGDSDATRLRDALQRALADGMAPAVVHLSLGLQQLQSGSNERAVMHLELAQKSNREIPIVLSGLTSVLMHQEDPDLPQALSVIDAAAGLTDDPRIRGTRAVVLGRLGRTADAVAELENVLAEHPDPPWVHAQLADLYRLLGDAARADKHGRQALAVEEKRATEP